MARQVALTSVNNPFDPIDDYWNWEDYDENKLGYYSKNYLARIYDLLFFERYGGNVDPEELSESAKQTLIEDAIDEICRLNLTGTYRKVVKE